MSSRLLGSLPTLVPFSKLPWRALPQLAWDSEIENSWRDTGKNLEEVAAHLKSAGSRLNFLQFPLSLSSSSESRTLAYPPFFPGERLLRIFRGAAPMDGTVEWRRYLFTPINHARSEIPLERYAGENQQKSDPAKLRVAINSYVVSIKRRASFEYDVY